MGRVNSIGAESAQSALRVFLVEDSVAVRDVMMENLALIPGIVVTGFSESESDALTRLRQQSCDVLILDIELKTGNGMSLLRRLSEENASSDSLKIIFSNNVNDACRTSGRHLGVRHFYDKTSEFSQLYMLLEELAAGITH